MAVPPGDSAFQRLRDICVRVEKFLGLVPHVLPIIGDDDFSPPMREQERRQIVDRELNGLDLDSVVWWELTRTIPECDSEITLLAASLRELQRRFAGEDEDYQKERDAQAQSEGDRRARGLVVKSARVFLPPERRIYPQEIEIIRSYLSLVTDGLDREERRQASTDTDEDGDAPPADSDQSTATSLPPHQEDQQFVGTPVILGKPGDEPIVNGKRKRKLTKPRYDVVKALLAVGEDGLSKDSLATESGHGDAHRILDRLAKADPDWKSVIQMAGEPGGRYRIRAVNLPTSPDISREAPTQRKRGQS
jgi:hypothetical protein